MDALSVGVETLGIEVPAAALASEEKNQNARAWFGADIATNAMRANPNMGNFGLNVIGERGEAVGLSYTEMAYIQCI